MTEQDLVVTDYTVFPMDRMRRGIGRRLAASVVEKPHVTLHAHARIDALDELRRTIMLPGSDDRAVSLTAAISLAVARALAANTRINGRFENDEIRLYSAVNLGIAVDIDGGLIVPVLRAAESMSMGELAGQLNERAQRGRDRTLTPADFADATFTITNLGMFGVELFTPIINPPQLAILGVGTATQRLKLREGTPVATRVMGLSLSFDHAAIDGADAARFLQQLISLIESPQALVDDRVSLAERTAS